MVCWVSGEDLDQRCNEHRWGRRGGPVRWPTFSNQFWPRLVPAKWVDTRKESVQMPLQGPSTCRHLDLGTTFKHNIWRDQLCAKRSKSYRDGCWHWPRNKGVNGKLTDCELLASTTLWRERPFNSVREMFRIISYSFTEINLDFISCPGGLRRRTLAAMRVKTQNVNSWKAVCSTNPVRERCYAGWVLKWLTHTQTW